MKTLTTLLLFVAFSILVLGDDDDGIFNRHQGSSGSPGDGQHRKFEFTQGPQTIDIIGQHYNDDTKTGTRVRFTFSDSLFPAFRIRRLSKDTSNDISGFQFRAGLLDVIEYREGVNGTSTDGYEPGIDTLVRVVPLRGQAPNEVFGDTISNVTTTDASGDSVYTWTADGQSPAGDTFSIQLMLSTTEMEVTGKHNQSKMVVRPNGFEHSITISNWNFQGRTDTRLALRAVIESDTAQRTHGGASADIPSAPGDTGYGIVIGSPTNPGENVGYITWDNNVTVTDSLGAETIVPIVRSVLKTTLNNLTFTESDLQNGEIDTDLQIIRQFIIFSILQDNPQTIYWDPYVGLGDDTADSSTAAGLLTVYLSVLLLLVKQIF